MEPETVIDLKRLAGRKCRITMQPGEEDDALLGQPELRQPRIACKYGAIFVNAHSGGLRAFCGNRRIIPRLAELGMAPTHTRWERDGHCSELTVDVPPERLDEVARLLKASRKRRVSDAERARLASMGRAVLTAHRALSGSLSQR
jgi:hypothetical protein